MDQTDFAPPLIDITRDRIGKLLDGYAAATGFPMTKVSKIARGEPKFASAFRDNNFTVGSYDLVVSRMSAVWPADLEWPADVPRQAPAVIEPELLADIAERLAGGPGYRKVKPKTVKANLPDGQDWPPDIPRQAVISPADHSNTEDIAHGKEAQA